TSDGYINIAASSDRLWERFCHAVDRSGWLAREEWKSQSGRSADREAIHSAIADVTREKPAAYWMDLFDDSGIPCGPIYSIDQVCGHPQVRHLGIAAEVDHPRLGQTELLNSAINLEGLPKGILAPTPEAGTHTAELLRDVGYSDGEIRDMQEKGII